VGKLIVVVGTSGAGKTTLVRALCKRGPFVAGLEEHYERPFQDLLKTDFRYALANQLDYLLLRAEQEHLLRQSLLTGLMDGGLEMDFHGFTRLFHAKSWLNDDEFDLCRRFYKLIRTIQPAPDLVIYLYAEPEVIARRLATRKRINLASAEDVLRLNYFLEEWLSIIPADRLLRIDVSDNDYGYRRLLPSLLLEIQHMGIH
jgi:deoxyadenosine/deoxycytidine kinase